MDFLDMVKEITMKFEERMAEKRRKRKLAKSTNKGAKE